VIGHRIALPPRDWDIQRAGDWPERERWLLSLGLSMVTIRKYRLDRYPYMASDAWQCMVREALRSHGTLTEEQYRRKRVQMAKAKQMDKEDAHAKR
jgi:hypothetical protein